MRDDVEIASIVECYGVLPVHRLEVRILPVQRLPRLFAHDVVNVSLVSPLLQVYQGRWQDIGLTSLDGWSHHAEAAAWHVLYGIEDAACFDHTFTGTAPPLAYQRLGHNLQNTRLNIIEEELFRLTCCYHLESPQNLRLLCQA